MAKVDFKILTQKKGPLPVWAWALIASVLVFMLYRRFKSGGGTATTPTDMSQGLMGTTSPAAAGDLTSSGANNAGNLSTDLYPDNKLSEASARLGQSAHDFIDRTNAIADTLDNTQGSTTGIGATDNTTTPAGDLGLVHIAGDFWWDKDQHKLIRIPGSGKAGTGKTKVPNTTKAGGKKPAPTRKNRRKISQSAPTNKPATRPGRALQAPPHIVKGRTTPKPAAHQQQLTAGERRAINRVTNQSAPKQPIQSPRKRNQPRQLPKTPGQRTGGRPH